MHFGKIISIGMKDLLQKFIIRLFVDDAIQSVMTPVSSAISIKASKSVSDRQLMIQFIFQPNLPNLEAIITQSNHLSVLTAALFYTIDSEQSPL